MAQISSPLDPPPSPQALIDGIKGYESTLGFSKTHNFGKSADVKAYYRCYYTGSLELPDSYVELKLKRGTASGCALDSRKLDVFFYPMEAVASGKTPVTTALASASPERILVVVPHEDYHARKDLPPALAEAAATLVGFVTAAAYARQQFGPASQVYHNLVVQPELFLQKAVLVNRYYDELRRLYQAHHAGEIDAEAALSTKAQLFAQLHSECAAISPNPRSFDKYLSADNNAGLAFDRTYTKYYPLVYDLFKSQRRDVKSTISVLDGLRDFNSLSEVQAVEKIHSVIADSP